MTDKTEATMLELVKLIAETILKKCQHDCATVTCERCTAMRKCVEELGEE